jgi:hypothetical protein
MAEPRRCAIYLLILPTLPLLIPWASRERESHILRAEIVQKGHRVSYWPDIWGVLAKIGSPGQGNLVHVSDGDKRLPLGWVSGLL